MDERTSVAWSDLEVEGGHSLSLTRHSKTRASGCHAHGEMMLAVLSSRNGYTRVCHCWRRGNETRDAPARP